MLLNKQSEDYIRNLTYTKTVIIPNFVDNAEIFEEHIIREHIKRVLYVGGVIESKGCLDIIEVAKNFPEIEFKLIGNIEEKCKFAAEKISNIVLAGTMPHSKIIDEMNEADVFMFLTFFPGEGFSNSLAEAMAAGLPCIVTDWAANKDMIETDGGSVVPVHGIHEAIQALSYMMDKEIRKKQSNFNISKVRLKYADERVQKQYIDCYEELIK